MGQSNRRKSGGGDDRAVVDGGENPAYPDFDALAFLRLGRVGDEDAFERILEKYGARLLAFLRCKCDVGACEDILQNVWLKLYKQDPAHFASEQHLISWLYQVASHEVVDRIRKEGALPKPNETREPDSEPDTLTKLPDCGPSPLDRVLDKESARAVWKCVQKLDGEQRQVIELLLKGMAQTDIKEVLGVSDSTVHRLKERALPFLRSCLELRRRHELKVAVPEGLV